MALAQPHFVYLASFCLSGGYFSFPSILPLFSICILSFLAEPTLAPGIVLSTFSRYLPKDKGIFLQAMDSTRTIGNQVA